MNRLNSSFLLIALSLLLFISCKTKTGDSAAQSSGNNEIATAGTEASGNASWSATIDGQEVSGKGIDELQLQNTAFIYPAQGNNDKYILFDLYSVKKGDDFYGFRFYSPDKEGQFAVQDAKKNGYRCSVRLDFNLRSTDNFAIYSGESVTLNIQSITATSMSGTFSGDFKLSDLSRSKPYKALISITNGKFNIPFSTGNVRPE
jgi:hypothetical protein